MPTPATEPGPHVVRMAAWVVLSWLGLYLHNSAELPRLTVLSPENSLSALLAGVLFAAWWVRSRSRAATVALLAWGLLHLIGGGILSVLPLELLPFAPEQTTRHYVVHGVYAAAQLPLILAMSARLRPPP